MPLFDELSRLSRRYEAACLSPLSCPRDREILRTRLLDLEETIKVLRVRAAKAIEISEAEQERLRRNLDQMRKTRQELKAIRDNGPPVIADKAALQDVETLLIYTRFIIGILENREAPKERNPQ